MLYLGLVPHCKWQRIKDGRAHTATLEKLDTEIFFYLHCCRKPENNLNSSVLILCSCHVSRLSKAENNKQ